MNGFLLCSKEENSNKIYYTPHYKKYKMEE